MEKSFENDFEFLGNDKYKFILKIKNIINKNEKLILNSKFFNTSNIPAILSYYNIIFIYKRKDNKGFIGIKS